jgi:hypothetical protein
MAEPFEYFPTPHCLQVALLVCPAGAELEYVPAGHGVQLTISLVANENVPGGHGMHWELPASE